MGGKYSIFIDENLKTRQIGGLCITDPHIVLEKIYLLRDQYFYYDEIKYSSISNYDVIFYKALIDLLIKIDFTYYIMDFPKIKIFSYQDFVGKVLHQHDTLFVFFDYFSNSGGLYIENLIYDKFSAVDYCLRQDSKSNLLLQLSDLLLGLYTRDVAIVSSHAKQELIMYATKKGLRDKLLLLENNFMNKKTDYSLGTVGSSVINNDNIVKKSENASKSQSKTKTIVITSGYFNPIHPGHIECMEMCAQLGDELWVIINSDHQARLKTGQDELYQDQEFRMTVVSSLKTVDRVMLSVDQDGSVCESIRTIADMIRSEYGSDTQIIFGKGGDRFAGNIPEVQVCQECTIQIRDGLGSKTHNSSEYGAKRL